MPGPTGHGDRWRPWRKASPELLARYVNVDAIAAAVPDTLFRTAEGMSLHDLRSQGRLDEVARALYDGLSGLNITYDLEPISLDDPVDTDQRIRKPSEIIGHEGTCVDLAVLYAGVCIKARLLPLILLIETQAGNLHALVVLDGRHTYDDANEPRGWSPEDRRLGFIQGKRNESLWTAPDGELWQRIATSSYIPVENTGFAATLADGRDRLRLSFDEARQRATDTIRNSRPVAAIDVVRLQKSKGYSAYVPEETVYRVVVDRYPDLADFMYDFTDLIESETAGFVGREWVVDKLAHFQSTTRAGYFCVVADAGLGKTALAADIASRYRAPAFFFSTTEGRTQIDECLRHLAVATIARYGLPHGHVPERAGRNWDFLRSILDEASAKSAEPVLLVVDAIDEAAESVGTNPLYLPRRLPDRVHVMLTSRIDVPLQIAPTTALQSLAIAASDRRQADDIDLFLDSQLARPELTMWLREHGYEKSAVAAQLKEASEGNFKYLGYVLRDLAQTDGGGSFLRVNALPVGLTQYYEQFWSAMESVQRSESWSDWDELYRPTIALLAAAMEPVTVDWLSQFVGRPAAEIRERALKRWIRFLRAQPRHDSWRIVHKSFADFLVRHHHVDVSAAHEHVVKWYLNQWGTLEAGLPHLSAEAARRPMQAYGLRHLVEHVRETGDQERLRMLVDHPRWYAVSLELDPSGASYQIDLTMARADAELAATNQLQRREPPVALAQEMTSALSIASINSLSYNLPAALLEALVACGHWTPGTALAAARMNPDPGERAGAIAALAPHLDGMVIEDALRIVRPLRFAVSARGALVRRLWAIASPERAFAEALAIADDDDQATVLGQITDLLPESLVVETIARLRELDARSDPRIQSPRPALDALANAIGAAPPTLLATIDDVVRRFDKPWARNQLLAAAARRWAELGDIEKAETLVPRITNESLRGLLWAQFVRFVPAGESATQSRLVGAFVAAADDMFALHRAEGIVAVAKVVEPRRLAELIREAWPAKNELGVDRVFGAIATVLPTEMLDIAGRVAADYDRDSVRGEAFVALAIRIAELGDVDRAIDTVARIGDSYDFGSAMVRLLPRIAEFGYPERAVQEAIVLERRGRDQFVSPAIVAVSTHVSRALLDRLRDRARAIRDYDDRRRALLGVAPRYAALGDPLEALRLARAIDDSDDRVRLEAEIGLAWGNLLGDFERALQEIKRLPAPLRFRYVQTISAQLPAKKLLDAISALDGDDRGNPVDRARADLDYRWALEAILARVGALGFADQACDIILSGAAAVERYQARATPDELLLVDVVRKVVVEATVDQVKAALAEVVPFANETSVRSIESRVSFDNAFGSTDLTRSMAQRYAALGLCTDALRAASRQESQAIHDTLGSLASALDPDGVRKALAMALSDSAYLQVQSVPALLARLAELELWDEAISEAKKLKYSEVALKSIGAMLQYVPTERLDSLHQLARARMTSGADERESTLEFVAEEVDAARATRLAAMGQAERAMEVAGTLSGLSGSLSAALTGIAPSLNGALLDAAIEKSATLASINWPDLQANAVAALLRRLAAGGLDGTRRALRIASDLPDARVRHRALRALVPAIVERPVTGGHELWIESMHVLSNRTRLHLFTDLDALLPVVTRLGGAEALDGVAGAVRDVVARWP